MDILYANQSLPSQAAAKVTWPQDATNRPGYCKIGEIELPPDTLIYPSVEKTIVNSKLLDGVAVTEKMGRQPWEVTIEFTLRMQQTTEGEKTYNLSTNYAGRWKNIFPQDYFNEVIKKAFMPDSVQTVVNSFLNGVEVLELVIKSVNCSPIRGSANLPVQIVAIENVPGDSLILD